MNLWDSRPLKDFCVEVEDRCANRNFPVFSVSKNLGILPQAERFKKRIASADTSRYKVVYSGDFAFDPMLLWSGSISRHTSSVTGVVSPAYCVFRLVKGLNPRFLHLYLTHPDRLPFYDSISFGTNERRRKAQFSDFAELKIPVPPVPEQERIVKLLGEGEELRKLRTQADCRTTDLIPALFNEIFGDPSINPQGFPISRIGELCETSPNYGTMVPARANEGEWLSLRVANIQDGLIDLTDQKFVDLPVEMLERHTVKDGDLLLARAIGSKDHLGKCIVARPSNHKWAFDSHLMRVRLNRLRCEPVWLKTLLDTSGGRQLFLNNTRQSAVQFNINTKEFASIAVPVPPLSLQKEFAARVSEIRAMQAEQSASRRRLDELFQSMLHRAFQGDL